MIWPVGLSEIGSDRKREQWQKTEHVFIRRAYVIPFKAQTNKPKNKQNRLSDLLPRSGGAGEIPSVPGFSGAPSPVASREQDGQRLPHK